MRALSVAIAACLLAFVTSILDREYYESLGMQILFN